LRAISRDVISDIPDRLCTDRAEENQGLDSGFSQECNRLGAAMAGLAATAAVELRHIPRKDWFLTVVATVVERGHPPRVLIVSCIDCPQRPQLSEPLDHFEVHEISTDYPQVLIFGCTSLVARADRKFLESLNRSGINQAEIPRSLARVMHGQRKDQPES
jgi:hypothetical protein